MGPRHPRCLLERRPALPRLDVDELGVLLQSGERIIPQAVLRLHRERVAYPQHLHHFTGAQCVLVVVTNTLAV